MSNTLGNATKFDWIQFWICISDHEKRRNVTMNELEMIHIYKYVFIRWWIENQCELLVTMGSG